MQEGSISAFAREAKGLCADAASAFRGNLLLLGAGAAWWGSHFLLLWNVPIAMLDSFVSGYDLAMFHMRFFRRASAGICIKDI